MIQHLSRIEVNLQSLNLLIIGLIEVYLGRVPTDVEITQHFDCRWKDDAYCYYWDDEPLGSLKHNDDGTMECRTWPLKRIKGI